MTTASPRCGSSGLPLKLTTVEKPAFRIAVSKAGNGGMLWPTFNVDMTGDIRCQSPFHALGSQSVPLGLQISELGLKP